MVEDAARKRPLVYDKGGDAHTTSPAFISRCAADPDASVYYLAAMLEGGEDARFIARRMIVLASEDIGLADPQALVVAVAAAQAVEHVGLPEARLNLAEAALYLALAPKSNAVITALGEAAQDVRELGHTRPPDELRDTHYYGATAGRGRATSIRTRIRAASRSITCRSRSAGKTYYRPSGSGNEKGTSMANEKLHERPGSAT
jgi:putative ATPase